MTRPRARHPTAIGAALVLAGACGAPAPASIQAAPTQSPPTLLPAGEVSFQTGETLRWTLAVGRVEAGRFWLRAHDVNAATARIVSGSRSAGVARFFRHIESQAVTLVSRQTGATTSSLFERRSQGELLRVSLHYGAGGIRGTVAWGGNASHSHARVSAGSIHPMNAETFLLSLRGWRPIRGARAVAVVVAVRDLWLLELEAGDARVIESPTGRRLARQIDGRATHLEADGTLDSSSVAKRIQIWVSDDELRLPLRVEAETLIGPIVVELIGVTRP